MGGKYSWYRTRQQWLSANAACLSKSSDNIGEFTILSILIAIVNREQIDGFVCKLLWRTRLFDHYDGFDKEFLTRFMLISLSST